MSLLESFLPSIAGKTRDWIVAQRAANVGDARPLTNDERSRFSDYFGAEALSAARIKHIERIENPPFFASVVQQAAFFGIHIQFDFGSAAGITFEDCILVKDVGPPIDLLFHEMVHVEQYRQLGAEKFALAYVQGMVTAKFIYEQIPLEAVAFEMTARFTSGKTFSVTDELSSWLRAKAYL